MSGIAAGVKGLGYEPASLTGGIGSSLYWQKVAGMEPVAYWQLGDTGGTVAQCLVNAAQNGSYTGVTLDNARGPDLSPVGLWDGINDFCDIYSTALNSAWDGDELTVALWVKVYDVAFWTNDWYKFIFLYADNNNFVSISTSANDGRAYIERKAGGAGKATEVDMSSSLAWFHAGITASVIADEQKAYIDGVQQGATLNGLGNWAGNLSATATVLGADNTSASKPYNGWLAHAVVFDRVLTGPQILDLATV
jgi:hypothetical protein